MATQLTFDDTRARLLAAMPALADGELAPADALRPPRVPAWVSEVGAVRDGSALWLWLDGAGRSQVAGNELTIDQMVLELPEGRYLVESYDVEARAWVGRESAASPPLVIGVPHRAGAVLLRVTRTAT